VTDLGGTAGTRGNITLPNAGNSFNTVTFTGGNIAWQEANAVTIGSVSANAGATSTGTLTITTTLGPITQTGAVTAAGTTTLAAGVANDITLNNGANDFSTVGVTSGNNVALTDANALDLGASTVSGTLNATANGAITDSGALVVAGITTLAAGAANNITLDTATSNFSTVAVTTGNNVTLVDTNALDLGASTVSGTLNVTTNGALTQSGALTIAGTTTLDAGGGNNITLTNGANNFSTVGITSGNNVSLVDANALDLGASTVSGTLNVTTAGALTQSGALTVAGATTLTAGAGNDINLTNGANDFSTVAVTSGNNVALTDANALDLAPSTASGVLTVTANGALTLNGATVGGNLSLTGNSITLASAPISVTGGSATLSAATTIIQNVNLTTAGAGSVGVTSTTGAISMSPTATTSSGTGTINYTAGTDVTLGALNTGGAVNVTAQGGSILSAGGAATHITAGANSTLQALGGIVGTLAMPIIVSVNPGSLGVAATTQVGGFSGVLTGTVVPSNTLNLLNVPPGCVSFNGVCVATGGGGTGGPGGISPSLLTKGTIVYLNPDVIVPTYNEKPSGSTTIQRLTSVYVPASLLEPSEVLISGGNEQRGTIASLVPKQATKQLGSQPISSPQVDLLRVDYFVSHIEFEPGQADLSPTGREILMQVSQILKSVADMRIQIEGHTDNMPISPRLRPMFPSNLALAKARATNAVRCLVEDGGIDPATISSVGHADTRPVASNATAEGRKKNRRIDIVLVPKDRPEAAPRSTASQPAR